MDAAERERTQEQLRRAVHAQGAAGRGISMTSDETQLKKEGKKRLHPERPHHREIYTTFPQFGGVDRETSVIGRTRTTG